MKYLPRAIAAFAASTIFAGCGNGSSVLTPPVQNTSSAGNSTTLASPLGPTSIVPGGSAAAALCPTSKDPQKAACLGSVRMMSTTTSAFPDSVNGLTPNDLASIYGYTAPASQGSTNAVVGIVVAYNNSALASDLATYRSYYNLPSCTVSSGCLTILGASNTTAASFRTRFSVSANPTTTISGWATEVDADTEIVSAVCPNCKIVVSEAATNNLSDLANAVTAAVNAGAVVVNASFGAPEASSDTSYASAFEPAPVKVVAAAGDNGPAALFPADAPDVISVSGTTLNVSGNTVSQSLWQNSGGGCSSVFSAASFQPGWCSGRSIADTAAVADPNTGVAFYDSAIGGWNIVGGTSISAPIISGMYALSGDYGNGTGASRLYAHSSRFVQVSGAGNIDGLGTPTSPSAL